LQLESRLVWVIKIFQESSKVLPIKVLAATSSDQLLVLLTFQWLYLLQT